MNKKELISTVSEKLKLRRRTVASTLDAIFEEILKAAVNEDPYHHPSFGKFVVSKQRGRRIHNVTTGSITEIPEKKLLRLISSRRMNKKLSKESSES